MYTESKHYRVYIMTFEFWLVVTAILFTRVGFALGRVHCIKTRGREIIKQNIQSLIDRGYILTRKNDDGTIEILKTDGTA